MPPSSLALRAPVCGRGLPCRCGARSGVRFFREAEMQEEILPLLAEWMEVQCWERDRILADEGSYCHSLVILHSGTLEARGRVHRTPGASARGAALAKRQAAAAVAAGEVDPTERLSPKTHPAYFGAYGTQLPQPRLLGPHDTLAPILLHPGAHFGEAALCGPHLPHTCSVRTVSRCTLLVLRRSKLEQELPLLPVTARQAWEEEALRYQKRFAALAARWRHHALRRLPLLQGLPANLFRTVDRLVEYRFVPPATALLRAGELVTHLVIIVNGEVGVYEPLLTTATATDAPAGGGDAPAFEPRLVRRVSDASTLPCVGIEPMALPTAAACCAGAPCELPVVTRTHCGMLLFPYAELRRRHTLHTELKTRIHDRRSRPCGLLGLLQSAAALLPPQPSARTKPGAAPAQLTQHGKGALAAV